MDAIQLLGAFLLVVQLAMTVVLWMFSRVMAANKDGLNALQRSLERVVTDNNSALREVRTAIDDLRTRVLSDGMPRSEFHAHRSEVWEAVNKLRDEVTRSNTILERIEAIGAAKQ